jgi:hypothetical protein
MNDLSKADIADTKAGGVAFAQQMLIALPGPACGPLLANTIVQLRLAVADAGYSASQTDMVVHAFADAATREWERITATNGSMASGHA